MGYKTILVHADESRHTPKRMKLAARLAMECDAHLIGVAATALPGTFYLPGVVGESAVTVTAYLDYLRERADGTLMEFESIAQKMGLSSYEKRIVNDEAGAGLCLQARYSDLVVVGQTDPEEALPALRAGFPEYVVMNSGRPVLVVPYAGEFEQLGKRVLVAWDASMEATRAVTAAIPFLRKSELVQVVVFDSKSRANAHGEQPGADIALWLSRHGIKVDVSQQTTANDIDTGNALLSYATDFNADMLVMGGYGHSRFREILLGGVTKTVLESMTVPVLMAH
ncbi:MAG TPA: universal stress protein [Noviherbaspirillum sp.]|nr:universal stress protein [Noviherbaspirillum sp.]